MTREQAEGRILELMKEIQAVMKEYAPDDDCMDMVINGDYIAFNNEYWNNSGRPIRYSTTLGSMEVPE